MNKKAPSGAQAVLRAIALLKAFTLERPERDVAELSDETGLRRSTVHRLLAALESEGLVTKEATPGRYRSRASLIRLRCALASAAVDQRREAGP